MGAGGGLFVAFLQQAVKAVGVSLLFGMALFAFGAWLRRLGVFAAARRLLVSSSGAVAPKFAGERHVPRARRAATDEAARVPLPREDAPIGEAALPPLQSYTYAPCGDLLATHTYTNNTDILTETYAYDMLGNRIATTDALGNTMYRTYDPLIRSRCRPTYSPRTRRTTAPCWPPTVSRPPRPNPKSWPISLRGEGERDEMTHVRPTRIHTKSLRIRER